MDDDFVRIHAKKLSIYAQMVYVVLCCHSNKDGITFIGQRKIAEQLNINKDTVTKSIKELVVSGMVGQLHSVKGKVSGFSIKSVRYEGLQLSAGVGHKEGIKELYKEREFSIKREQETAHNPNSPAYKAFREKVSKMFRPPKINH